MTPNLKRSLKILAGRAAGIALTAVLGTLEKSGVPHDTRGALVVVGVALGAVVAASPNLFAAAGILRPLTPGQLSLYQKAVGGVTTLLSTPAAKRKQKAQEDLQAFLDSPQTLETLRSRLLSREQLWQPGQPVPATDAVPEKAGPQIVSGPGALVTGDTRSG